MKTICTNRHNIRR